MAKIQKTKLKTQSWQTGGRNHAFISYDGNIIGMLYLHADGTLTLSQSDESIERARLLRAGYPVPGGISVAADGEPVYPDGKVEDESTYGADANGNDDDQAAMLEDMKRRHRAA